VGPPQSSFGETVRVYRRRHGMSQDDLAAVTGIATRSIRNIEAGRVGQPRGSTVRLLADAFGLDSAEREAFIAGPQTAAAPVAAPAIVPAQLPRDVAAFAGRGDDLARLWSLLETGAFPVISGTAGVGKTNPGSRHIFRDQFAVLWDEFVRCRGSLRIAALGCGRSCGLQGYLAGSCPAPRSRGYGVCGWR
jgi:transcriptional regulator with XRE-family HTH domain